MKYLSAAGLPRVLVVDDEADFVETATKRLRKKGLHCEGAVSGHEAYDCLSKREFDVVLLDVRLGDMNGNELLLKIKNERPEMQVVMLSGHASLSAGREGLRLGAVDYLLKPVEFETLYERIMHAGLARARLSDMSKDQESKTKEEGL